MDGWDWSWELGGGVLIAIALALAIEGRKTDCVWEGRHTIVEIEEEDLD